MPRALDRELQSAAHAGGFLYPAWGYRRPIVSPMAIVVMRDPIDPQVATDLTTPRQQKRDSAPSSKLLALVVNRGRAGGASRLQQECVFRLED